MQANEELAEHAYYQCDSYLLDPDSRTLRYENQLVELTPKVFTTLLVLVENRDKIVN